MSERELEALQVPDPAVRLDAAIALQRVGGYLEHTLPVLVNDIAAVDEAREYEWQWALKRIGRQAIAALADKATEPNLETEYKLLALRTIACEFYKDHGAAIEQMESMLGSGGEVSAWAAVILAKAEKPIHAHDAFLAALRSEDERLVAEAVYAMHNFKGRPREEQQRVKAAFLPCLTHASDRVRGNCCMFTQFELDETDLQQLALAEDDPIDAVIALLSRTTHPPETAIPLLIRGLFSENYDTRESSAPRALLRIGSAAIEPVLKVATNKRNDPDARAAALSVFYKMESAPASLEPPLRKILREKYKPSSWAAMVLARLGAVDSEVIQKLVAGLEYHESESDNRGLKQCLERLPSEQTIPALIVALKRADGDCQKELAMLLSTVGFNSPDAAQAIVDVLVRCDDDEVRNMLANALANFEDRAVPPVLKALSAKRKPQQIIRLVQGLDHLHSDAIAAVPHLLPLLKHSDPDVRFHVADAIAAIEPTNPASWPILLDALYSRGVSRRYATLNRLEWMDSSAAACVPRLIELLDDAEFRCSAAKVLGEIGPAAAPAIPKLAEICESENWYDAIRPLGRMRHPAVVPHLRAALENDRKFENAMEAFQHLGDLAEPCVDKLRTMLTGPARLSATQWISRLGKVAASAAPDLIPLLADSDQEVRVAAIEALGNLQSGGEQLLLLAQDDEPAIRATALSNLGGPRPAAAIPLLMSAANSNDLEMVKAALSGLAGYGVDAPVEFMPLLIRGLDDPSDEIRWAAMYAIKRMGPAAKTAVPKITSLLTDPNFSETAFTTLQYMGPAAAEALPAMEQLLGDHRFRRLARYAIQKISPERYRELGFLPIR